MPAAFLHHHGLYQLGVFGDAVLIGIDLNDRRVCLDLRADRNIGAAPFAAAKQGNAEAVFGYKNMAYDAHAQKRDDEALRLLRTAQQYFPDDVTLQADILELERK